MPSSKWPRRAALVFACLGATAAVGTASAAAATVPGQNIYGMGSSLQAEAQVANNGTGSKTGGTCGSSGWLGWVAVWRCTPADQSTLSNAPLTATYTTESSGVGLAEFGNVASSSCTSTTGVLSPACDPTAEVAGAGGTAELDAYIGTDDPPNSTDLTNAATAAGGGVQEITLPVSQAPVAMILSIPVGITVGTNGEVKLTSQEVANLWSAGVPNWCDLLTSGGLTRITSGTPTSKQFLDPTGACNASITLQARSKGSGTTFSFRGFLYELDKYGLTSSYPYTLVTDGPSDWPVTVSETGNTSGGALVADTTATPGSAGYANLADAAFGTPGYTNKVQTTTIGGTHQIVYAFVQNNAPDATPFFASPSNSTGTVNIYTGTHIGENVSTCAAPSTARVVGCWVVPATAVGAWSSTSESTPGSIPSDADVFDHGTGSTGAASHAYPIVATTYDVAWTDYDLAHSNMDLNHYYDDPTCPSGTNCNSDTGWTAGSFLRYLTGAGQSNLASAKVYYGALPAAIKTKAAAAAKAITP